MEYQLARIVLAIIALIALYMSRQTWREIKILDRLNTDGRSKPIGSWISMGVGLTIGLAIGVMLASE